VGIPVAHVTTMTPVALMVGSHRIIPGSGICYPVGNMELDPQIEKTLRWAIFATALEALQTEVTEQKLFPYSNA
jgi:betaine reductase